MIVSATNKGVFMLKQACLLCKIVGIIAIVGALNWGLIGVLKLNLVERLLGGIPHATRGAYVLVGLSGLALLVSFFTTCPACKKS